MSIPTIKAIRSYSYYYKVIDTATVDGQPWYTVKCAPGPANWIRQQTDKSYSWFETDAYVGNSTFDINESLYIMLCLKWPNPQ